MSTLRSRGIETITALRFRGLTCTRMIVSVRWPLTATVPTRLSSCSESPSLVSEPTSRKLSVPLEGARFSTDWAFLETIWLTSRQPRNRATSPTTSSSTTEITASRRSRRPRAEVPDRLLGGGVGAPGDPPVRTARPSASRFSQRPSGTALDLRSLTLSTLPMDGRDGVHAGGRREWPRRRTSLTWWFVHHPRRAPGGNRPLVTWYHGALGQRIELSRATFGNWVAKTANLLVEELGLEPGERVAVLLPSHWLGPALLAACWRAGVCAVPAGPGLELQAAVELLEDAGCAACFVHEDLLAEVASRFPAGAPALLALTDDPFGRSRADLGAALPFARVAASMPDHFDGEGAPEAEALLAADPDGARSWTQAALAASGYGTATASTAGWFSTGPPGWSPASPCPCWREPAWCWSATPTRRSCPGDWRTSGSRAPCSPRSRPSGSRPAAARSRRSGCWWSRSPVTHSGAPKLCRT